MTQSWKLGWKMKSWEVWTSFALISICDFWVILLFEEDGRGRWSATFFLCPKINPKSYYQEKRRRKSFCLAFCCSGHKQQPGIKGAAGAQDLISTRFSSHKHPFSCPGPRQLSLCEVEAWFLMECSAALLSMDPTTDSDPTSLENLSTFVPEIFGPKTVPDLVVKCNSMEPRGLA